jgi:hypothetical protein
VAHDHGSGDEGVVEEVEEAVFSAVDLLRGGGGRIASDGLVPTFAFFVGDKAAGLGVGVALALLAAVIAGYRARRQGRRGLLPWLTVAGVVVQGTIGLLSGDAKGFFAPQLVTGAVWGLAFVGSVVVGRPLISVFARELFPIPDEIRATGEYRRLTGTLSLVFGGTILLRAAIRAVQLVNGSVDGFVLVTVLTGPPVSVAMIAWGLWFSRRALARLDAAGGLGMA